jgi:hypothetical protein
VSARGRENGRAGVPASREWTNDVGAWFGARGHAPSQNAPRRWGYSHAAGFGVRLGFPEDCDVGNIALPSAEEVDEIAASLGDSFLAMTKGSGGWCGEEIAASLGDSFLAMTKGSGGWCGEEIAASLGDSFLLRTHCVSR